MNDEGTATTNTDKEADIGPASGDADSGRPMTSDEIHAKVKRMFRLVPEIGTRWRWYDIPYRFLHFFVTSWRRRFVPRGLRRWLNQAMNIFVCFESLEREKVAPLNDPMDNLQVPAGEKIEQGGLWVVELFPPSQYASLNRALEKNGWARQEYSSGVYGTNAERVTEARRGVGWSWSRLGSVVDLDSKRATFDETRERLPPEFEAIHLTAVQIGQSLTAVVAFIQFGEQGRLSLNRVWTTNHEPMMEWRGIRRPPRIENRSFAAIRHTEQERQRLHDLGRVWLSAKCPGFFATANGGQPVVDFNMFDRFDPTKSVRSQRMTDPLRALGMSNEVIYSYVSPQIPGATFARGTSLPRGNDPLRNCWGVLCSYEVMANIDGRVGYGSRPYSVSTLSAMFTDEIRAFILCVAVLRYTNQLRETLSAARDTAQTKYGKFKPRQLDRLRRELLTTSLDLPVISRDSALVWTSEWRAWYGIEVEAVPAPGIERPPEKYDLIEDFGKAHAEEFERLVVEDAAYRDVLATVAALGASAADARLGRRAVLVAGASLVVAFLTLLVAMGEPSILAQLVEWIR